MHELQSLAQQTSEITPSHGTATEKMLADLLGLKISRTDLAYIYRGAAMILRQGSISLKTDEKLRNVYNSNAEQVYSSYHLDRDSINVGKYLIAKCVAKEKLFGHQDSMMPAPTDFGKSSPLMQKAEKTKSVTIKRTSMKLEKEKKSKVLLDEEKRKRKITREKKRVEMLGARMNACQAIVKTDGSKAAVPKAEGIKKAIKCVLYDAQKMLKELPQNRLPDWFLAESVKSIPVEAEKVGVITVEFAGVKFKKDHHTGDEYLSFVQKTVIQKYLRMFCNVHHMSISEEKYSFTPRCF